MAVLAHIWQSFRYLCVGSATLMPPSSISLPAFMPWNPTARMPVAVHAPNEELMSRFAPHFFRSSPSSSPLYCAMVCSIRFSLVLCNGTGDRGPDWQIVFDPVRRRWRRAISQCGNRGPDASASVRADGCGHGGWNCEERRKLGPFAEVHVLQYFYWGHGLCDTMRLAEVVVQIVS